MPEEAKKFNYFVFGGILGDFPPQKRTKKRLRGLKAERRNLGKKMSTDTAVYVTKEIIKGKKPRELEFEERLVVPVKKGEEIILPFRYVLVGGKPLLPKGFKEFVKRKGF